MPNTASPSINKSELIRLARSATKAAIYPYKTAEESVRKPSFFKQPRPSAIKVFSSDIYSNAQTLEIQSELKKVFREELYVALTSLHETKGIADDLERAAENSKLSLIADELYQKVVSKNDGKTPIFELFCRKIFEEFGEPYLNTLDRSAKASIILLALGLLLITAAIAGSFLGAPFATVIAPFVLCGFGLSFMSIAIQGVKNIINSYQAENDRFVLPKIVTPAEVVYPEETSSPIGQINFV
jgi:hypothetical protein